MTGQEISINYPSGGVPAYSTQPDSGSGVGVIVISAIFGVDEDTKEICDDLATAGYPAMALNMFWADEKDNGPLAVSPENAELGKARAGRVPREEGNAYIGAAIEAMKAQSSCNGKVAIFGFCYGGPFVVEAAAQFDVAGGISFHGSFVEKFLDKFSDINCPLEFHYGDNDEVAPMAAVEQVKAACDQQDNAELFVYPGGQHGYMFPNRGAGYLAEAAGLSWQRAISFLSKI